MEKSYIIEQSAVEEIQELIKKYEFEIYEYFKSKKINNILKFNEDMLNYQLIFKTSRPKEFKHLTIIPSSLGIKISIYDNDIFTINKIKK